MTIPAYTGEPWDGSVLVLGNRALSGIPLVPDYDKVLILFMLAVSVAAMVLYRRYVEGVSGAASICVSYNRALETFNDRTTMRSILLSFLVSIPLYGYAFLRSGAASVSFWWILAILCALFVSRHVICAVSGWLTNRMEPFKLLEMTSIGCFLLIMVLSVAVLVPMTVFPSAGNRVHLIYLASVFGIGVLIYFARSYRIFVQSGFSSFFWFLYLCGFEILPMCVAVNVLVSNGN